MKSIVFVLSAFASVGWTAPIPATSSSLLVSEKPGLFRSVKGFTISSEKTEWVLDEAPREMPSIVTVFKSPEMHRGLQPVLTVRVDELNQRTDLKEYMKRSMKDYALFGFNVLRAKPVKVSSQTGFLVDLDEAKAGKRLRQLVFMRDRVAVVMTCRDRPENFDETVKQCDQIFKNFEWNSSAPSSQTGA